MDLWERVPHAGLVGVAEAEGYAREVRAARGVEEEEKSLSHKFHSALLSGKLIQAVCWETDMEGGGCLLPGDLCTKTG